MINMVLSWLHLRQDALTKASAALQDCKQMLEAQQVTIEEQRKLIDHELPASVPRPRLRGQIGETE